MQSVFTPAVILSALSRAGLNPYIEGSKLKIAGAAKLPPCDLAVLKLAEKELIAKLRRAKK